MFQILPTHKNLYYKNFPLETKELVTELGFLNDKEGAYKLLTEFDTPLLVWTGTGQIHQLETTILSETTQKILNLKSLTIFFWEIMGVSVDGINGGEIPASVPLDKYRLIDLESVTKFVRSNKLTNVTVYTCEYNIQKFQNKYPEVTLKCFDIFLRSLKHSKQFKNINNNVIKPFWCGNWRYMPSRHIITAYLQQYPGNYSWHLSCTYDVVEKNNWFDFEKLKSNNVQQYTKLKQGIDFLEHTSLKIDIDIETKAVTSCSVFCTPAIDEGPKTAELIKSYEESFCAIVTETIFATPLAYVSEKTTRAMCANLPFILVAGPNSLEYLKKLGFKTFDRWWDESYDQEQDHEKRILMIMDLIDYIGSKSINDLKDIYTDMKEVLDHNSELFRNFVNDRQIF
jgi:hypothetical protein